MITKRQLNKLYRQALVAMMAGLLALASSFSLTSVLFFIGAERQIFGDYISFFPVISAGIGLLSFLGAAALTGTAMISPFLFYLFRTARGEEGIEELREDIKRGWKLARFGNPFVLPFISVSFLWRNRPHFLFRTR